VTRWSGAFASCVKGGGPAAKPGRPNRARTSGVVTEETVQPPWRTFRSSRPRAPVRPESFTTPDEEVALPSTLRHLVRTATTPGTVRAMVCANE